MLEFHPIANLFPLIDGVEFDLLVADIREKELLERIVIHDGKILDGRNRYRAIQAAGYTIQEDTLPVAVSPDGDVKDWFVRFAEPDFSADVVARGPLDWVISKNFRRRNLNASQSAMVAASVATMRQGERTDLQPSANLPKVSQSDAAKLLNVSERLVRDAKVVKDRAIPEIVRAVEQGKLPVSEAAHAAKLPAEIQRQCAESADANKANVVRTIIKQARRTEREAELGAKQQALPQKRYGVVLADPEWQFEVWNRDTGLDRSPDNHYPTSSEEEIAARDVASIAADDCVCLIWTTDLARGIRTLERWGFRFVSYFAWVKDIVQQGVVRDEHGRERRIFVEIGPAGTGFWNRDRDEICLIGTRGNIPCPAPGTQGESVIFAARPRQDDADRGRHSAKPDDIYEWAEKHYPNLPKIELNARRARPGWDCWGNEAPASANENTAPGDMLGDAGEPAEENDEFPPEVQEPRDGDDEFSDEAKQESEP